MLLLFVVVVFFCLFVSLLLKKQKQTNYKEKKKKKKLLAVQPDIFCMVEKVPPPLPIFFRVRLNFELYLLHSMYLERINTL